MRKKGGNCPVEGRVEQGGRSDRGQDVRSIGGSKRLVLWCKLCRLVFIYILFRGNSQARGGVSQSSFRLLQRKDCAKRVSTRFRSSTGQVFVTSKTRCDSEQKRGSPRKDPLTEVEKKKMASWENVSSASGTSCVAANLMVSKKRYEFFYTMSPRGSTHGKLAESAPRIPGTSKLFRRKGEPVVVICILLA